MQPFTCFDGFWAAHNALPYPPPPPLPLPAALPAVSEAVAAACSDRLEPAGLGIMTPEEEMSNAQLEYQVGADQPLCVCSCTLLESDQVVPAGGSSHP